MIPKGLPRREVEVVHCATEQNAHADEEGGGGGGAAEPEEALPSIGAVPPKGAAATYRGRQGCPALGPYCPDLPLVSARSDMVRWSRSY